MNIKSIPINSIKTADYNPRVITESEFGGLKKSLEEFGQQENFIVNTDMTLISGHQRLQAAKALGWTEVICNVIDVDKKTEKKLNVVMNSHAISGNFDDLKLSEILEELRFDEDYNELRLDTLEPLDLSDVKIEEDEAPEASETEPPKSKSGDVYQLGRHRLMCGDATKKSDVEMLMNGVKAGMVFTDPPYGVNFQSNLRTKSPKFDVIDNDDVMLTEWIEPVVSASNGFIFIWTTWKVLKEWIDITSVIGDMTNMVIWNKGGGGIGDLSRTLSTDYEIALVFNRGSEIKGKRIGSVWSVGKDAAQLYSHPTQKPVELAAIAMKTVTNRGDTVLDVFGGSGSTLIAAEQTNRTCYMMELDPKYVDVIRKRYHKYITGSEEGWEESTPVIRNSGD